MTLIYNLIFYLLNCLVISAFALPQPNYSKLLQRRWWFNAALGVSGTKSLQGSSFSNDSGIGGEVSANYRFKYHWLLTARLSRETNFPFITGRSMGCALSGVTKCRRTRDWIGDAGILGGYIMQGDYGYGSISAGASYVRGHSSTLQGGTSDFRAFGIPIESQIFWTPTGYLGLGLIAFGNINGHRLFGGTLLALQFGGHQYTQGDDNSSAEAVLK